MTYIRYAESARINWAHNYATHIDSAHRKEWSELWTPKGDGLILRSIKTEFKFVGDPRGSQSMTVADVASTQPMAWPDHVSVYHKLRSLPSSSTDSFELDVVILSERHQRPAARCVEDIVVYDYRQGKKTPLRPFMLDQFRETYDLQLQAKNNSGARVRSLHDRVRRLEQSSWDRQDAKEDFGSASP